MALKEPKRLPYVGGDDWLVFGDSTRRNEESRWSLQGERIYDLVAL